MERLESDRCETPRVRAAVVGHVEWVEFVRVDRVPEPGEIIHADETWAEPAGGGAVAAMQLLKLAGSATFYTALGDDELGHRAARELRAAGLRVETVFRPEPQRRALTFLDGDGERTITVIGDRMVPRRADPLPWDELADHDAVYVTGGDPGAVRAARAADVLVATPRALQALAEARVELDALVGSATDANERYRPGDLQPPPRVVVRTAGAQGGTYECDGRAVAFPAAPLPRTGGDAYGAGDSFAAGLTFGLGTGLALDDALALAARCGAAARSGRGAFAGQLRLQ
jgi:ribokinase